MWFQKQTRKGRVNLLMKEECKSPITLYTPSLEDLWFRQKMMADEETMSYNMHGEVQFLSQKRLGMAGMIFGL